MTRLSKEWNMLTIAWTGTICTDPAILYISLRTERHSYPMLLRRMGFTLNLTTIAMAKATDWAGVRSGMAMTNGKRRDSHRCREKCGFPTIQESPQSIECVVKEVIHLGTHDMFVAEVLYIRADSKWIHASSGAFSLKEGGLLGYSVGGYYSLGEFFGKFGFSVRKKI